MLFRSFKPEDRLTVWRGDIDRWRKFGDTAMGLDLKGRAIRAEHGLAEAEDRPPASWATTPAKEAA